MNITKLLSAAMIAGLSIGGVAHAAPVAGTTNGTLSSISGCTAPATCIQINSNQIIWGGTLFLGFIPVDPSTSTSSVLNAIDGPISDADGLDVTLGQLSWINRSTPDSQTDDSFNVNWSLADTFTSPVGTGTLTNLSVNIQNTQNPAGDLIVGFSTSGFSYNVPGYTIQNLELVADAGSTYTNGTWRNLEGHNATLTLRGDFVPNAVPEPMSMALLGTGLVAMGFVTRRRQAPK